MKIELGFTEALAIANARQLVPPMVESLRCEGSTVFAEIDLGAIPTDSFGMRLALAAAGTVSVSGRLTGFADGIATVVITAHARGLPAHKLVPYLLDTVNGAIRDAGLPDGLVEIRRGDPDPIAIINVQRGVDTVVAGVTVTDVRLVDAIIHAEAEVGTVRFV